jgi:uncharacterized protein
VANPRRPVTSTVDANVLIHGANVDSPYQAAAKEFIEQHLAGPELVYLFWPTAMAYLRVSTHPGIFRRPQSIEVATANIGDLLRRPNVRTAGERERFWAEFHGVALDARPSANLISDAHLVALMRENGVSTIWTQDRDFRRFRGIEARDPFTAT